MGKMVEVAKVMGKFNAEITALQEIGWKENGCINKDNFEMFYSDESKQGKGRVVFILINKLENEVTGF